MPTRPKTITHLTKIGNSRGIRIPKALIEQAGLTEASELELIARDGEILIANHRRPREGWAEAMEAAYARGDLELTEEDLDWLNMKSLPDELPADEDPWWE
ncbi:MAG TPA: AbrB/MazE/SpoVT family DNA-binding domain-containing protein [Candidatus Saccharimonadia bacterium]|nr:AbrB/MazE/SpoVT family DNA-binding domain-containing protein [Candidatus Saccharimonadia bacterium]